MQDSNAIAYDYSIAKAYTILAIVLGIVGMTIGVLIAFQLAFPDLNYLGGEYLTFSRLRPMHTDSVAFGFTVSGIFATWYYVGQRVLKVSMAESKFLLNLAKFQVLLYVLTVAAVVVSLLLGYTTSKEYAELISRRFPPKVVGVGTRIGIYAGGLGADKLIVGLKGVPGLCAFSVYRLRLDHLAVAQVFILQQLSDVADFTPDAIAALRQWVEGGGRLILTHDAVGFRWHQTLFPEIGKGIGRGTTRKVVTTVPIGQRPAGWAFEHSYADHVRLAAGPKGRVLAVETGPNGAPVLVVGHVGKGIVILSGILPGYTSAPLSTAEKELFLGLIGSR